MWLGRIDPRSRVVILVLFCRLSCYRIVCDGFMLSHPCAFLDSSFTDDTVCVQTFPTMILSAVLGSLVVGKLGDWFGLVAASAVFGFHLFGTPW